MFYCLSILAFLFATTSVQAELLRILHTNDLHAQLTGVQDELKLGGYAELKAKMDQLALKSEKEGVPVLRLDAGDFSEGALDYKANDGLNVFEIMEMMNYDAVALGNHDYLMGAKRLNEVLDQTNVPLVAANIEINSDQLAMKQKLLPYRLIKKGKLKIAVIGGTTSDIFYHWVLKNKVKFNDPSKAINKLAMDLEKKQISDVTIALTHIGVPEDQKVVSESTKIDLIVGGHTHAKLDEPIWAKNKNEKPIAIVQTGEHGKYLGEILVDIKPKNAPGERVHVISYKLHPIHQNSEKNTTITTKINETKQVLNDFYGDEFLHETLGVTTVPMQAFSDKSSYWSTFFTDAIKEVTGAQISMNNYVFLGPVQAKGPVTREKIMNFFPRFFNLDNKEGWTIYVSQVKGSWVKRLIQLSVKLGYPFLVSGMTYDLGTNGKGQKVATNFKIGDRPLDLKTKYKVAIPEGYYRGLSSISQFSANLILKDAEDSHISVWSAVEEKLAKTNQLK
ncbi:MAG: bifunctional metallophosphatase/5'-nucleotidase [Bacteriovoracaceae bacterium]